MKCWIDKKNQLKQKIWDEIQKTSAEMLQWLMRKSKLNFKNPFVLEDAIYKT